MKWTDEQQKVIDYRNRNILVSAAAGSGKTAVLVERIIKRITDKENPTDIDKLLVVTFTKAAAAEMRERIGNAIEKQLEENPEDENLRKQQTLIHNAQITTIDSFCLFVVRNHFEEIQLEPNFRIADTGEIKLLEMDVLDAVFEAEFTRAKEVSEILRDHPAQEELSLANRESLRFLELIDAYSDKRSNRAVKDMVSKIYHQSASNPWPKEWIESLSRPYLVESEEELLETELMKGIFTYVKNMLLEYPSRLEELKHIALQPDGPQKYAETIDKDLSLLEGIEDLSDYKQMEKFFKDISFSALSAIRNFTGDVVKKEAVSSGRSAIKEEILELKKRYFSMPLESLMKQLEGMRPIAEELVRLSLLYLKAMEEKKAEKHIMDFSDIEHAALRILVDEDSKELRPTALEFQQHLDEIMIDEYQDSNQVQEEIMCAISRQSQGEYNMFMVGDVKQSIYRFRLARPELFMEKFATYDLEESKRQRIDLHKNFRSRQEVVDFTNDIFYKIMGQDLGNVTYDADAALYAGATYPKHDEMAAEVLLYETEPEEETASQDNSDDNLTKRQLEARMVAEKIIELKKTLLVTDKATGNLRPLRNSDIVILFRSLQGWGNDFASVLEDLGIPVHVSTSTGYFSAIEVQTILSFLKILDNPYQDIPMAAVLKSAIVGLDNEELAEISLFRTESQADETDMQGNAGTKEVGQPRGFAEAVLCAMKDAEEEFARDNSTKWKLYQFKRLYDRLRSRVSDTPIHQLIDMVLEETGYGDYVKALPSGLQRSANLFMLLEKAIAYEKTSYKGLFHFVRYIDQLQKYEVDFGEADIIGENEDVVRLMTIHKSKGLEFSVVFVSGIAKKFNEMDSRDKMAIHPDMGLGLDEIRSNPRIKRSCLIRSEIADRIRRDNLGEELRVLYVALTRAKEKLILTGTVNNQEGLFDKHKGNVKEGKLLSFGQRVKAKGYIDWIVPAMLSYPDKYGISFVTAKDLIFAEAKSEAARVIEKEVLLSQIQRADETLVEELKKQLAYKYPYDLGAGKKSKYSVSELKHASMVENYDRMEGEVEVPSFILEERESYVPEFARDKQLPHSKMDSVVEGKYVDETEMDFPQVEDKPVVESYGAVSGALYGTAVHRVMECLDFKGYLQIDRNSDAAIRNFVQKEMERMRENALITDEMKEMVNPYLLRKFFTSPVALRMAEADARGDLFREKPFVMDYEGVLVQGIIDVFWLEDDKIVLLDYKTDRVDTAEELITRYKTQLDLYGDALKRVFSTKEHIIEDAESLIYSFKLGIVIEV